jgi:hypothetical protein
MSQQEEPDLLMSVGAMGSAEALDIENLIRFLTGWPDLSAYLLCDGAGQQAQNNSQLSERGRTPDGQKVTLPRSTPTSGVALRE